MKSTWPTITKASTKKTVKPSTTTPPAPARPGRRPLPDLAALERKANRDAEAEWEASINAGAEPPRWLPRRRGWLVGGGLRPRR